MPRRISRNQAMTRIEASHDGECPLCTIVAQDSPLVLERSRHSVAALSRFPVRWGQMVVALTEHVVCYSEVSAEKWAELSELALRWAQRLERTLRPARCYVVSTGTSVEGLAMTTPHLHFNVIPVDDPDARPKDVLTWSHGILTASDDEWAELRESLTVRNLDDPRQLRE